MRTTLALILAACSSPGSPVTTDAAAADASPDAATPPDASLFDCPVRTQPAGMPEHPYPPIEIYPNSVTLRTEGDVAALLSYKVIVGDLTIADTLTSVTLPNLEVIEGQVVPASSVLEEVHFPRLETTRGFRAWRAPFYDVVALADAPRLVDGGAYVHAQAVDFTCLARGGAELVGVQGASLSLPSLVSGGMALGDVDASVVDAPRLVHDQIEVQGSTVTTLHSGSPDSVRIFGTPSLVSVSLSGANLTSIDLDTTGLADLDGFHGMTQLASLSIRVAPALHSLAAAAGNPIAVLLVDRAPLLVDFSPIASAPFAVMLWVFSSGATALAFPNVTYTNTVRIVGNASLTSLAMPSLTSLGGAQASAISDNPMLPNCQATMIRDRVPGSEASFGIVGNLADACH